MIRKALEIESMNWHKPHTIAATGGANGSGARARALGATPTAPCFQFLTTILDGFHSLAIRNKPGAADLCTHMYEAQIAVYLVQDVRFVLYSNFQREISSATPSMSSISRRIFLRRLRAAVLIGNKDDFLL